MVTQNWVVYAPSSACSSSLRLSLSYPSPAVLVLWRWLIFCPKQFCPRLCGAKLLCYCRYFTLVSPGIQGICCHSVCQLVSCVPLFLLSRYNKIWRKNGLSEIKFLLVLRKEVVRKSRQTEFITPVPLDKRIAALEWCYMCSRVHTLLNTSHMHFIRQSIIQPWDAESKPTTLCKFTAQEMERSCFPSAH